MISHWQRSKTISKQIWREFNEAGEAAKLKISIGSLLSWDNDCRKGDKKRIANAMVVMARFKNIWKSKHISIQTKT